jgi:hypothetical protein
MCIKVQFVYNVNIYLFLVLPILQVQKKMFLILFHTSGMQKDIRNVNQRD